MKNLSKITQLPPTTTTTTPIEKKPSSSSSSSLSNSLSTSTTSLSETTLSKVQIERLRELLVARKYELEEKENKWLNQINEEYEKYMENINRDRVRMKIEINETIERQKNNIKNIMKYARDCSIYSDSLEYDHYQQVNNQLQTVLSNSLLIQNISQDIICDSVVPSNTPELIKKEWKQNTSFRQSIFELCKTKNNSYNNNNNNNNIDELSKVKSNNEKTKSINAWSRADIGKQMQTINWKDWFLTATELIQSRKMYRDVHHYFIEICSRSSLSLSAIHTNSKIVFSDFINEEGTCLDLSDQGLHRLRPIQREQLKYTLALQYHVAKQINYKGYDIFNNPKYSFASVIANISKINLNKNEIKVEDIKWIAEIVSSKFCQIEYLTLKQCEKIGKEHLDAWVEVFARARQYIKKIEEWSLTTLAIDCLDPVVDDITKHSFRLDLFRYTNITELIMDNQLYQRDVATRQFRFIRTLIKLF